MVRADTRVWKRDVVLKRIHHFLLNMKSITTLITAWTWGWRFLKPQKFCIPPAALIDPLIQSCSSYFFQCHLHSCYDAPNLAFDPHELWNMIVWTASGEIQEVQRQTSKLKATMASFLQGNHILSWTCAAVSLPVDRAEVITLILLAIIGYENMNSVSVVKISSRV